MLSKKPESKKKSFFHQLLQLIFHPSQFFKSVEYDKDANKALMWAFVAFVMQAILALLFSFGLQQFLYSLAAKFNTKVPEAAVGYFSEVLLSEGIFLFCLIIMVLLIPLLHWLLVKVGAKGSWQQTVKSLFYPLAGFFLLSWIPVIGYLSFIWYLFAQFVALKILHKMNMKQFLIFLVVSTIIELIVIFILLIIAVIAMAIVGVVNAS